MAASQGRYDVGDLVRMRATVVSTDGITPADASTVSWLVMSAGSVGTYQSVGGAGGSIGRAGVGAYFKDVTVDVYGDWVYRVIATGGAQTAEEWQFTVDHSKFSL